jgi:hypothetical protein
MTITIFNGSTSITPIVISCNPKLKESNIGFIGWINQPVVLDYDIWNKSVEELDYELKVTNAEKWFLDYMVVNQQTATITDSTYGLSAVNFWLKSIDAKLSSEQIKQWTYGIALIKT